MLILHVLFRTLFFLLVIVNRSEEALTNDFSCDHAVQGDISESSFLNQVFLILFGDLILEIKCLMGALFSLRVEHLSNFDHDQLLQLVDVANVHRHLKNLVV